MRIVTAMALLGTAGVLSGCNVQQPSAGCQVQDGVWQASYTLKNPADASKSCGKLKGEALGAFKYVKYNEASRPAYMGLRPQRAAELAVYTDKDGNPQPRVTPPAAGGTDLTDATDPTGALRAATEATSLSTTYTSQPDSKGLCQASGFAPITVSAKAVVDGDDNALPAETVSYTFSDVNVYSAASAPGTQLQGTLVFGDGTGCTAEYQVRALWPQAACATDADCGSEAGLNPDFDAVCVADIGPLDAKGNAQGGCVPRKDVPSFK